MIRTTSVEDSVNEITRSRFAGEWPIFDLAMLVAGVILVRKDPSQQIGKNESRL